jgi:uncharacterized membrane protein YkvA (DUF1232 family)
MRLIRPVRVLTSLWADSVGTVRRPGPPGAVERFAAVPRMVAATLRGEYDGLSRGKLGLMAFAVAYLLTPVSVIPSAFVTDVLAVVWLVGTLLSEAERFLVWEAARGTVVRGEVVHGVAA